MSISDTTHPTMPPSILDTDLYKLTMQNAVLHHFPDAISEYRFTNRAPDMLFSRNTFDWVQLRVNELSNMRLTHEERDWLQSSCPFFTTKYLDFLASLRLNPAEQVEMTFKPQTEEDSQEMGLVEMTIKGPWRECILYEVPLMAILSEGYFLQTRPAPTYWNCSANDVKGLAYDKAYALLAASEGRIAFSEFGTRRRRSYQIQKWVIEGLQKGANQYKHDAEAKNQIVKGGLAGTSNVHLAMLYDLKPVGTIAHEWIMAIGAKEKYQSTNGKAMDLWEAVYPPSPTSTLHTMLTDTYTASIFFQEFTLDPIRANRWNGLRHDSGDPTEFAKSAKKAWIQVAESEDETKALQGKRLIFSDGLDVETALRIWRDCEEIGVNASFGIGTFFTNDFDDPKAPGAKSKPLNMVIKLRSVDGLECVKLSDDRGKWTGDRGEVSKCREMLGLNDENERVSDIRAEGLTG